MSLTRPWAWVALACVVLYGFRAVAAWRDGWAYPIGKRLAAEGRYERALPLLERGAIGPKRPAALWLAGQVRVAMWHQRALAGEPAEQIDALLSGAFRAHTEALSMSPASGWYRVSLGEVYHRQEQVERFQYGVPLDLVARGPWAFVGRPGRIAIGLTRLGIAREPTWFLFHDQLALMLLDNDLDDAALDAVRRSAAALPHYHQHAYRDLDPPPSEILDAFAEGARAALGRAPLLPRVVHRVSLGRLEYHRGAWALAVQDLEEALGDPSLGVYGGAANLYLGLALIELGRLDEAAEALIRAQAYPRTAVAALDGRARLAERNGDLETALAILREARRLEPRRLDLALRFARIARRMEDWPRAEEALRWAVALAPERPGPLKELVEIHIEQGDLTEARRLLADLARLPGTEREVRTLRARLSPSGGQP